MLGFTLEVHVWPVSVAVKFWADRIVVWSKARLINVIIWFKSPIASICTNMIFGVSNSIWLCWPVTLTFVISGKSMQLLNRNTLSTASTSDSLRAKSPIMNTFPLVALTCVVLPVVGIAMNSKPEPIKTKLLRTISGFNEDVMLVSWRAMRASATGPLTATAPSLLAM